MAYKRLLTGLFICLFSFLLMSHNTFAYSELGQGFQRDYRVSSSAMVWYEYANGWVNAPAMNANGALAFSLTNADYVRNVNRFLIFFDGNPAPFDGGNKYVIYIPFRFCVNNPDDLKAFVGFSGNGFSNVISQETFNINGYCLGGNLTMLFQPNSLTRTLFLGSGNDNGVIIGEIDNGFSMVFNKATIVPVIGDDIPTADEIADAVNDAQEQATQDAADDSSTAGSSSSSDATTATSSLLSTITGFFNAIISVNPSNCKFNSNLPFLPGNGEIDLCSISTPPIVQTLSSLVLVGLFIPFCIHMFNRFVSITESFQR